MMPSFYTEKRQDASQLERLQLTPPPTPDDSARQTDLEHVLAILRRRALVRQRTLVFAGILTDALSGSVAALIGITGLFGGAARYAAVLAGSSEREIERATAFGFFVGFGVGALVLAIDSST